MQQRISPIVLTLGLALAWGLVALAGLLFLLASRPRTDAVASLAASATAAATNAPVFGPPSPTRTPTPIPPTFTPEPSPSPTPIPATPTPPPALVIAPPASPARIIPTPIIIYITATPSPTPVRPSPTAVRPGSSTPAATPVIHVPPPPAPAAPPPGATDNPLPPPAAPSGSFRQPSVTAPPDRLIIPKIGVNAPVVTLGIDANNYMQAPSAPDVVAWYDFSAAPGSPGNAVMSGHVDFRGVGPAVFWRLKELEIGDSIRVIGVDGAEYRYVVADTASYAAAGPPVEQILGRTTYQALTLITCDGIFNPETRQYDRRLVIRAVRG